MLQPDSEYLGRLEAKNALLRTAVTANPGLAARTVDFWTYLQQSEAKLIAFMSNQPLPETAPGDLEMGPILYLLHQLPPEVVATLNKLGMPPTNITDAEISSWEVKLKGPGVVGGDGTLFAEQKWAQFDIGWTLAVLEYLAHHLDIETKAPFATNPQTISISNKSALNIALVGDWGTGFWQDGSQPFCPSQSVIQQIKNKNPDIVIHLGDVYYAGTQGIVDEIGEEDEHLVKVWPSFPMSFTLNSNHEMYNGANGYYKVALKSAAFSMQKGTSYFAIEFGNWIIFGLDTAYYDPSPLYMKGALPEGDQTTFIRSFNLTGKQILVLTHHTGLTTDGTQTTGLWSQVCAALGRTPDYWYWGHTHNGIVYSPEAASGSACCRCCGHGSLPFGNAHDLHDAAGNVIPQVAYYAHTPLPNANAQQTNRVLNGFAFLTLTDSTISESFYDQTGALAWPGS